MARSHQLFSHLKDDHQRFSALEQMDEGNPRVFTEGLRTNIGEKQPRHGQVFTTVALPKSRDAFGH